MSDSTPNGKGAARPGPVGALPPHALEIEQAVLGCALLAPADCMPEIVDVVGEDVSYFYDTRHQALWESMLFLHRGGAKVDLVTLQAGLKGAGKLDEVGGRGYLAELPDKVASPAMIGTYLDELRHFWRRRRVIQIASRAMRLAQEMPLDLKSEELLAGVEKDVGDVLATQTKAVIEPGSVVLERVVTKLHDTYTRGGAQMEGISTGFQYLDKMTGGLAPGEFIVIAARPGIGKTSLALDITGTTAKNGGTVGIFSLEMTKMAMVRRLLFQMSKVDAQRIRTGFGTDADFQQLTIAGSQMVEWSKRVHIDDTSGLTALQFESRAKMMVERLGCGLLVLDYLQLMRSTGRHKDREMEVRECADAVMKVAKELQVPVITLAQLNRESEKNKRPPELHDLRESGSTEQNAHQVWGLYKPNLSDEEEEAFVRWRAEEARVAGISEDDWSKIAQRVNLRVLKHREGPQGEFRLLFRKHCTSFEAYTGPVEVPGWGAVEPSKPGKAGKTTKEVYRADNDPFYGV